MSVCLQNYQLLRKQYRKNIELRLSNRDLSNSVLITDDYIFYEPYFGIIELDTKAISVFEVASENNIDLYQDAKKYFSTIWKTSYTYSNYNKQKHIFEEKVKTYFEG